MGSFLFFILILGVAVLNVLTPMDSPMAPADYARAQVMCQGLGGIRAVRVERYMFRQARTIKAKCSSGADISAPAPAPEPQPGQ